MTTKLYDNSGYELTFEDDIPESERQHYLTVYPIVDKVAERRIHCTSCNQHIGTAPQAESRIRMHPVLKVTHCRNCHSFYNSGEFDKGEDGSELYCRWCGQGGEVYCCSSCPYVFCKKCITSNFSRSMITEIEKQDNWECFSCSPQILFNLRAQHWALCNYIEKQLKKIRDANLPAVEHDAQMAMDSTTCCRRKSEVIKKPAPAQAKKRSASPQRAPPAKKPPERVFRASTLLGGGTSAPQLAVRPAQTPTRATSNLVCAPDILSMFSDEPLDIPAPAPTPTPRITISAQQQRRNAEPVPPLAVRQYVGAQVRGPAPSRAPQQQSIPMVQISTAQSSRPVSFQRQQAGPATSGAVYHTIHGFRIDLNTAASQETFRLPNGKMIQVKKQPPPNAMVAAPVPAHRAQPRNIGGQFQGNAMGVRYQVPQQAHQQQIRLLNGGQAPQIVQQTYPIQPVRPGLSLQPPPMTLEKPSHPPTPLGIARNAFEFKVLNTLEICHQIIGKINTLTNYPSYKNVNHISELKDLYKHLSYLLSYTVGRFKGLQDKCTQESKALGFDEEAEKVQEGNDDELEVVEQQTTVIEIDSDAEDDGPVQPPSEPITVLSPKKLMEPRPSVSSVDSEPVGPSLCVVIGEFNDPKLQMEPRVDLMRAECLIPSVNQLLKNEAKHPTVSTPTKELEEKAEEAMEITENNEEDDLLSNLLEVTPDISVMMGLNDDKEEVDGGVVSDDDDSVIELADSPDPLNTEDGMTEKTEAEPVKLPVEVTNVEEKAPEVTHIEEKAPEDDDEIVILSQTTEDTLSQVEDKLLDESMEVTDETPETVDDDQKVEETGNETEKSDEKTEENPKKDEETEKEPETETEEPPAEDSETADLSETITEPKEPLSKDPETSEQPVNEPESMDSSSEDFKTPEPLETEPESNNEPKTAETEAAQLPATPETPFQNGFPENDIEMTDVTQLDTENLQSNTDEPKSTEKSDDERQLTLQDVELLGDDDLNPEKELATLNKPGEDLSIEDFNLGESELNDLAENLEQDGWDI